VGMILFISTQDCKSNVGLNNAVRDNCTSLILFKTKDISELKQISEAFSGEIPVENFMNLYEAVTNVPHNFIFVDIHYINDKYPSGF